MAKTIIGIMGPGENATPDENEVAFELGRAVAKNGWVVLTGGRSFGVMDAAMKGAHEEDGLTIGILPNDNSANASDHADIKIMTGMGSARNVVNILSSHVIVVIGMAAGTASEVSLALKANKKVILLNQDEITIRFFKNIGTYKVMIASTVDEVVNMIRDYLTVYHVY